MGMIEIKNDFTKTELLWFGPLMALFVGIIGGFAVHRFSAYRVAYVLWAASTVLIFLYYLIPPLRKPTYMAWMYAVMPIGWVVSHLLLIAIYFLLLTPIGFMMRLCGYDPMNRTLDRSAKSYWIPREARRSKASYFKQY